MKVLVTGGAGHLGANLVRRLLAAGDANIRALARRGDNNEGLSGLDLEVVWGDLRDVDSLRAAVKGVDRIYHTAAQISTVDGKEQELFDNNVIGTKNLLLAAREAGVGRVVVTGSFSAVGHRHDDLPSRMGAVLRDFANGRLRAYIPGGFEFVAARDIAEGHVLAMHKGRTGHKYIISSGFQSMDDLMGIMERVTGRPRPRRLPAAVMAAIAPVTQLVQSTLFPSRPQRLTPGAIRILRLGRHADTSKARKELGFAPTPIEDAVREAYEFFAARGQIEHPVTNAARKRAVG
jgi:3beta-hydroxysteroid-4beta-carboxylate 3-dehydrogenase (decarboxylating)